MGNMANTGLFLLCFYSS